MTENGSTARQPVPEKETRVGKIVVAENGPYQVTGGIPLFRQTIVADENGESRSWERGESLTVADSYRLCRCGRSANKPFCDDTHVRTPFNGKEVAARGNYKGLAEVTTGPALDLTDVGVLCASGRFCDPDGSVWDMIAKSGDPAVRAQVEVMVGNCPSGRLALWRKPDGQPIEPKLPDGIAFVEDPAAGVSGPLWVTGGITIESPDGRAYEVRNRVTLCRCGASRNKPFCDATHIRVKFNDGLLETND